MGRPLGRLRRWLKRSAAAAFLTALLVPMGFLALDRAFPLPVDRFEEAPGAGPSVEAADGALLARRVAAVDEQWRIPLPLEAMGEWLPAATIAIEDERFRGHHGVDPRATCRAAWVNLRRGRVSQGGSTLTMQLVGLRLRTPRTLGGKGVEAFRALQLERAWPKDRILEVYLNAVSYGGNLVGAGAGAESWFGKAPADLTLGEAALLAGLPQAPARLRPDRHPAAARARRDRVLAAMERLGSIDAEQRARAERAPLPTSMGSLAHAPGGRVHAVEWALARRAGGGATFIDPVLQGLIEGTIRSHRRRFPAGTDIAAVLIDIEAAAVVAHVGSADPSDPLDGLVDGARARRSPGSALKPFVYGAAFDAGVLGPDSELDDGPMDLAGWRPANFDGDFDGRVEVADALRRSLNVPALRAARAAGLGRVIGVIESAGIELPAGAFDDTGLALVTGGAPITLVDLCTGYATLGRGGLHVPTRLFRDETLQHPSRALSKSSAEALFTILSDTARAPLVAGGVSHVGGHGFMWKTGTSSGHADALAAGHDRRHALAVWVGRFDGAGDPSYLGQTAAEPILAEVFARLSSR